MKDKWRPTLNWVVENLTKPRLKEKTFDFICEKIKLHNPPPYVQPLKVEGLMNQEQEIYTINF